jgi:hypothetical protein
MLRLLPLLLVGFLALPSCVHAPPTLSQPAQIAFQKTRIIKALDVLRDFAVDGEAATPKAVSTDLARKIVTYHQSTLHIIDAAGTGWKPLVSTGLDEFLSQLSQAEQTRLRPYVGLIKALLAEVG